MNQPIDSLIQRWLGWMWSVLSSPIRLRLSAMFGHCLAQWQGTSIYLGITNLEYGLTRIIYWTALEQNVWTYREGQFLASEDPDARDAAVVVSAKQDDAGKGILSEFVKALEHTCCKTDKPYQQWMTFPGHKCVLRETERHLNGQEWIKLFPVV